MKESKFKIFVKVILIILVFSFLMLGMMFLYSTGSGPNVVANLIDKPVLILLNLLPILVTTLIIYTILGRLKLSLVINFVIYTLIFIVNRVKILYRSDTFRISDLRLGVEGLNMSSQGYGLDKVSIFLLIVSFSLLIFLLTIKKVPVFKIYYRLPLLAFVLLVTFLFLPGIFKNDKIYSSIPIHGSFYNTVDNYNSRGTLYSVINNALRTKINPPDNYNKDYFGEIDKKNRDKELEKITRNERPHIIWLMGEAYSELAQEPVFEFTEEDHPNKNLMEIKKDAPFWGSIITHSFGGGTGDTEFDALTGAMSKNYSPYLSSAFNTIIKDTRSLPSLFNDIGYETYAFHPGFEWFYRRSTVYKRLGFSKTKFVESIKNPVNKGDYFSQEVFTDIFLDDFRRSIQGDKPVFHYGVDIQNHGPYFYDKYGYIYDFSTNVPIKDKSKEILSSYFIGLKDIDKSLGRIYEEINKIDEPIIFVFYGDHLPGLGEGTDIYKELGININGPTFEDEMKTYRTPFFITGNKKGKEYLKTENIEIKNKQSISVNYVGSLVLDLLGYTDGDKFFAYTSDLRKDYRIISNNFIYQDEKAIPLSKISNKDKKRLDEYEGYQYYRIRELKN